MAPIDFSSSGLFRSADGGTTWTELTPENSKGFPKKPYGRLAVAIAPSNAKRVYVFVESTDSALFVSDDGGLTWNKRDKSNWMVWRPFYFANLSRRSEKSGSRFQNGRCAHLERRRLEKVLPWSADS